MGTTYTMVGYQEENPLWVYQWLLTGGVGVELLQTPTEAVLPTAIPMRPGELHCTASVSSEPVPLYQDTFLLQPYASIRLDRLYWSGERSALSVALTDERREFFHVPGSVPHVSLTRGPGDEWKDLGRFTKRRQVSDPNPIASIVFTILTGVFAVYKCLN